MPEIPDLEGYRSYLNARLPGQRVETAEAPIPWLIRTGGDEFVKRMPGQVFEPIERVAKLLIFPFESGDRFVVHAMLAGRFQYVEPKHRRRSVTSWVLGLENGMEFRYFDQRRMGRMYLIRPEQFDEVVPRWTEMGPDVMDPQLTPEKWLELLKKSRAQIKSVITNERIVAGIGNAYSDEILWEAKLHPFRKRSDIPDEEIIGLFHAMRRVMEWSIPIVTREMEEKGLPPNHYRKHLRVHRKADDECPRCGHRISEITSGKKVTNFCRECQPGLER
ncbi:MAG: Fpg/Nei family DNA glycosylase [Chloroflexi bacterium]|nr:Fpg/Nei family DNA glycosylase [Chloroflexota bacterium]